MIIKLLYIISVSLASYVFAQDVDENTFLPDMGVVIQPTVKLGKVEQPIIDETDIVKSNSILNKNESNSVFAAKASDMISSIDRITNQVSNIEKDYQSKIEQLETENSNLRNQIISLKQRLNSETLNVNSIGVESVKPEIEVSLPLEISSVDHGIVEEIDPQSENISHKIVLKDFDEDILKDLTNSIKERGVIQPIIVRKSSTENSKFEIIAGERRWLAARKAGLHEIPVVITEADDLKSLEFAIVENVQRHDLNPLEEAQGYKRLIDEFSYDQEKVSKFIGKSRSHITNSLRLLTLPDDVVKLIETQKLSAGHAKILVGLSNASFVASKIIEKKLSVRQAENFVLLFKNKKHKSKNTKDTNIIALELSISNKIGINVDIQNNKRNKGKISFEYKDLDQLNKIIDIIKSNY